MLRRLVLAALFVVPLVGCDKSAPPAPVEIVAANDSALPPSPPSAPSAPVPVVASAYVRPPTASSQEVAPTDPHFARLKALQDAQDFGMLGLLNAGPAPSASLGKDESLRANMFGDAIGDSFGAGGLGLQGIGEGGGGRGEGIGLGSIGTLGHGAGTGRGDGQGMGSGSGRLSHSKPSQPKQAGDTSTDKTGPTIGGKPLALVTATEIESALKKAGAEVTGRHSKDGAPGVVIFEVKKGTTTFTITFVPASAGWSALPTDERDRLFKVAAMRTEGGLTIAIESDDLAAARSLLAQLSD